MAYKMVNLQRFSRDYTRWLPHTYEIFALVVSSILVSFVIPLFGSGCISTATHTTYISYTPSRTTRATSFRFGCDSAVIATICAAPRPRLVRLFRTASTIKIQPPSPTIHQFELRRSCPTFRAEPPLVSLLMATTLTAGL